MHEEALDPYTFGEEQACFGCGPKNLLGLRLAFHKVGDEVITRFVPQRGYEGPPGILHGGVSAAIADEVGAWTMIGFLGRMGLTTAMQLRLIRPLRIGVQAEGRGQIIAQTPTLVTVRTTLIQEQKRAVAGRITYALVDRSTAERVMGQSLPETWSRFCG